jgi:hypothetical protein
MRLLALAVIVSVVGGLVVWQLSGESGAEPACPGNPNPPPRCTPTPTATATAGATATPTPTATETSTPTASASPVPQAREDQITMYSAGTQPPGGFAQCSEGWCTATAIPTVALDASDYPTNSLFRFEGADWLYIFPTCARLFDMTANIPVVGSEVCGAANERVRSGAFTISVSEHEYTLQAAETNGSLPLAARIIAEWTEVAP